MIPRPAAALLALALVATMTTGCLAQPEAEPSPTFGSEKEAFAAAEATYRAYVHALNEVDLSDPATFEGVYAWTTGELNSSDRRSFSKWHANGYVMTGDAVAASVSPVPADSEDPTESIQIDACYDVSAVDVTDSSGLSLVSPERPSLQPLRITVVGSNTSPTTLVVSSIDPAPEGFQC